MRPRDQGRGFLMIPDNDGSLRARIRGAAESRNVRVSAAARKMLEYALRRSHDKILGTPLDTAHDSRNTRQQEVNDE